MPSKFSLRGLIAAVVLAILIGAAPMDGRAQTISDIRVEGTQRIDPETVRSYLLVKPGDTLDAESLDRALKALFATGLFADVSLKREGSILVAQVVENPIINRIQFEGNRRVKDEILNQEVQLRSRQVYTRT